MSTQNFVKSVWSARLIANMYSNMQLYNLGTTRFDGEARFGSQVNIHKPTSVTVNDYTGTVTYENAASSRVVLNIDKQKYFGFQIPDLVLEQTSQDLNLIDVYTQDAGMKLAEAAEVEIAKLHSSTDIPTGQRLTAVNATFVDQIKAARTLLNKNNVPAAGRWLVVSPEAGQLLLDAVGTAQYKDSVLVGGAVPTLYGFNIVESNAIQVATNVHNCLFGSAAGLAFGGAVEKVRIMELESSFQYGVSGYYSFGTKVLDPKAIGRIAVTIS